jgi:hypothetical protein
MRLFKFLAVFTIVLGLVYVVVIGLNMNVFKSVFTNQEALAEGSEWVEKTFSLSGLVDFMHAHPHMVSVTLDDTSGVTSPGALAIRFGDQTPRSMAGTGHLILLATYARLVQDGRISPDSTLTRAQIQRFVVPGFEPSKHRETLRLLTELNQSKDAFTIDTIVQAMIQRNHQPSADAIFALLGTEEIAYTIESSGIQGISKPALWAAFHIAVASVHSDSAAYQLSYQVNKQRLLESSDTDVATLLTVATGQQEISYSFFDEKNAYRHLPKSLPGSMAQFMVRILNTSDTGIRAVEVAKSQLRWPMNDTKVARDFSELYALYDSRLSLSHGLTVGTSAYTQRTQVATVYFDQLPIGFWMHMSSNLINQDYQMRLIYDHALYERSFSVLMEKQTDSTQPETNSGDQQL